VNSEEVMASKNEGVAQVGHDKGRSVNNKKLQRAGPGGKGGQLAGKGFRKEREGSLTEEWRGGILWRLKTWERGRREKTVGGKINRGKDV